MFFWYILTPTNIYIYKCVVDVITIYIHMKRHLYIWWGSKVHFQVILNSPFSNLEKDRAF